mgnify:CR=1 FL=1
MDEQASDSPGSSWAGNSILIVDDTVANLLAYSSILKRLGCRIVLASSGREALQRTLEEDFDLIMMDIRMPEMSGIETAEFLRGRDKTRRTLILFMSAHQVPAAHLPLDLLGPHVDFLPSLVDPETLAARVEEEFRNASRSKQVDSDPELQKTSSSPDSAPLDFPDPLEFGGTAGKMPA